MSNQLSPDAAIARRALSQGGAFRRKQARESGLSEDQIQHRLTSGTWVKLFPSMYAFSSSPVTWMTWAWAGVLSAGHGGVVVGGSAAALRGWLPRAWPITIAVPPTSRQRWPVARLRPLKLDIPAADVVKPNGLAVTNRVRTACDVAHLLPLDVAQQLLDRLLVLEEIDLVTLTESIAASRRNGCRQARAIVRRAADFAASEAERVCHRLLRAAGLDWFVANYAITIDGCIYKADLAYLRERVALEVQGWAYHRTPERRRADDAKAVALQLAGWVVIPITWQDLVSRPQWVVATVRRAIERGAAA